MDWILKLIDKHTKDGQLDQEKLIKDINKEFPKYAVPKEKYNALAERNEKLEEDLKVRDEQLEQLKEIDVDGLKEQIETLQEENRQAKEDYEKELKELQLSNAIKLALSGKVHDEDIAANLIKRDELVLADGKVIGLDEQIEKLKEEKGFLFIQDRPEDDAGFKIGNPRQEKQGQGIDNAIAAAFGNLEEK